MPRSVLERMHRYGNDELDLAFRQIAVTAEDVRSGQFTSHAANTSDVNYRRYRDECLREGIDPHIAVEVEALNPGLLRSRLNDAIGDQVDDIRRWNIQFRTEEAERELLRTLPGRMNALLRRPPAEIDDDGE